MTPASLSTFTALSSAATDEEVVERVRAGETALFEIIMRRYNQRLYRVTRSILGNDAEAEDVMQDAYVRSYLHLDQFDGGAKFSTWLTRIAVHEALARLRKRWRFIEFEAESKSTETGASLESKTPSPEQEMLTRTMRTVLDVAADRLPLSYRSVYMLRDVEGISIKETAQSLNISEDVVKVRLHRARALMRKVIYAQTGATTMGHF